MLKRIEITEELIEIFEACDEPIDPGECMTCPYFGPCLEYYTGDNSENRG